jgi:hypothetical protein
LDIAERRDGDSCSYGFRAMLGGNGLHSPQTRNGQLSEDDPKKKGKGRDTGYALAARSLRGSQQRGSMHHHGP